ncbi:hypothetical protein D3C73_362120 [compost metagenome]
MENIIFDFIKSATKEDYIQLRTMIVDSKRDSFKEVISSLDNIIALEVLTNEK